MQQSCEIEIARPARARRTWANWIPVVILGAAALGLLLTSPYTADIWWSDASRHAMDGAFFHDLLREMPVTDLKRYAMDYYLRYPALSLLFYPPLFSFVEAIFFALFGVSHFAAHLTVAAFALAAALGAYCIVRQSMSAACALAASLLFLGMPEVAYWGRQVMLEIPACAFLFWAAYAALRYRDSGRTRFLYWTWMLTAAGVYTKQTVIFAVPVFLWLLWRGRANKHFWGSLALFGVILAPQVFLTLRFGHVNVNSVVGGQWNTVPVFSVKGFVYYARQLPAQTGLPTLLAAGIYLTALLFRRDWLEPAEKLFLYWLAAGYLFFSLIALKEPRHTIPILFPLAFFAVRALARVLPRPAAGVVALGLAALSFGHTLLRKPVPYVEGYRKAADFVATRAPHNGVVLFSGYRDGAFIFDLRAREDRRDLATLRADKLLLRVMQRRELGVEEKVTSAAEIVEMLNRSGVSMVVSQPNFWIDLKPMQELQRVLRGAGFRKIATIPISANVAHTDRALEIYENLSPLPATGARIRLELPLAGLSVEGNLTSGGK